MGAKRDRVYTTTSISNIGCGNSSCFCSGKCKQPTRLSDAIVKKENSLFNCLVSDSLSKT